MDNRYCVFNWTENKKKVKKSKGMTINIGNKDENVFKLLPRNSKPKDEVLIQ